MAVGILIKFLSPVPQDRVHTPSKKMPLLQRPCSAQMCSLQDLYMCLTLHHLSTVTASWGMTHSA